MKNNRLHPVLAASLALALSLTSAQAADVIFNGTILRTGINDSGTFIDSAGIVGIDQSPGKNGVYTGFDYFKPGTPFEFGAVAHDGNAVAYGYFLGNTITGTTTNTSAGSIFSTSTTGAFGLLGISQQLAFANNSGTIDFSVTLTNNGTSTMSNVAYARGLDPDQDVFAGGGYPTTNNIVNGNLVTASAPVSGWTIGIFSDSDIAHLPTVHADWSYQSTSNPYYLLDPKNDGNGDYSINMAWNIGELAAGESANIKFQYRIAESFDDVVVPPTHGVADAGSTVGLLGLGLGALAAFKARKRRA